MNMILRFWILTKRRIQVKYVRKESHGLHESNARGAFEISVAEGEMCREDTAVSLSCSLSAILRRHLPEWNFTLLATLYAMWTYESPKEVKDNTGMKWNLTSQKQVSFFSSSHKDWMKYKASKTSMRPWKALFRKINAEMFSYRAIRLCLLIM